LDLNKNLGLLIGNCKSALPLEGWAVFDGPWDEELLSGNRELGRDTEAQGIGPTHHLVFQHAQPIQTMPYFLMQRLQRLPDIAQLEAITNV
jgi:hypothetical protein